MSWAGAVNQFAIAYRRMLLRHPHAVPLLATHPVDVEIGLTLLAGVLDRFDAAGVAQPHALTVVQSVAVYTLGHALAQVGTPPGADATATPADPIPAADRDKDGDTDGDADTDYHQRWFDAGLRALILGFRHQLDDQDVGDLETGQRSGPRV